MKKSELKSLIKEEIRSILNEKIHGRNTTIGTKLLTKFVNTFKSFESIDDINAKWNSYKSKFHKSIIDELKSSGLKLSDIQSITIWYNPVWKKSVTPQGVFYLPNVIINIAFNDDIPAKKYLKVVKGALNIPVNEKAILIFGNKVNTRNTIQIEDLFAVTKD